MSRLGPEVPRPNPNFVLAPLGHAKAFCADFERTELLPLVETADGISEVLN